MYRACILVSRMYLACILFLMSRSEECEDFSKETGAALSCSPSCLCLGEAPFVREWVQSPRSPAFFIYFRSRKLRIRMQD